MSNMNPIAAIAQISHWTGVRRGAGGAELPGDGSAMHSPEGGPMIPRVRMNHQRPDVAHGGAPIGTIRVGPKIDTASGTRTPPDTRILIAASTVMSSSTTSERRRMKMKPLVGFGVVATNTVHSS